MFVSAGYSWLDYFIGYWCNQTVLCFCWNGYEMESNPTTGMSGSTGSTGSWHGSVHVLDRFSNNRMRP
jgi:hypothetical protein